jgi:hypothetical protein
VFLCVDEVDERPFLGAGGIDLLLFGEHLPELRRAGPPSCKGQSANRNTIVSAMA